MTHITSDEGGNVLDDSKIYHLNISARITQKDGSLRFDSTFR